MAQGRELNLKLAWRFQSEESSFQCEGHVQQLGPPRGIESCPFLAGTLAPTFLSPSALGSSNSHSLAYCFSCHQKPSSVQLCGVGKREQVQRKAGE